ncbi:MAG TPA: AAA family ATPase [Candidatus Nanoarchaeia archaeon]|nr:AAA family ATPase [Candidatus Nanoarchaeia archaeon]
MGVFDKILKDSESLFQNELALDYTFIPKIIPFRENQQQYLAGCIKPLFQKRTGKNILITGSHGIGKTVAVKHVLKELEDQTEEISILYINCWKKNSSYKVLLELCDLLNIKFIQSLTTEQVAKRVSSIINKKPAVICLDEIDKLENQDLLYLLSEDIFKKTIILITNEYDFLSKLDPRIKSRLALDILEFKPYSEKEMYEILKQRIDYAFPPKVFPLLSLKEISEIAFQAKDVRSGIYLLKESGLIAEQESSRVITQEHIQKSIEKFKDFQVKDKQETPEQIQGLLEFIKQNQNKTSTELFDLYAPKTSYRTFHRNLQKLESSGLIKLEETNKGPGKSTIVKLPLQDTLDKF